MPIRFPAALAAILVLAAPSDAVAHEFWLEPSDASPAESDTVTAVIKVGEMMNGTELPFLSHRFTRFTVTTPEATYDVKRREGDRPAVAYDHEEPGLHIIAHEAEPMQTRFGTWKEFTEYLAYEGLDQIAVEHKERGLPVGPVIEDYSRHAKALLQVGPVQPGDADRALGLQLELVAGANPYDPRVETVPVTLLWQGAPVSGLQLSVFRKAADGTVTREILRTDSNGKAMIRRMPDAAHLLNAVQMLEGESSTPEPAGWHSHWASLYFGPE